MLLFQNIGVQLRLLSALGNIHAGSLGLHYSQRSSIISVEHIVGISHSRSVRHAKELHFVLPILILGPSRCLQHGVYVNLPGLVLGNIKWLRHVGLLLLCTAGGQFLLESLVFGNQLVQSYCICSRRLHCYRFFRRFLQKVTIKNPFFVLISITAGNKIEENEKVFKAKLRLFPFNGLRIMGRLITCLAYENHPLQYVLIYYITKVLSPHENRQSILIGLLQTCIHGVHPLHGELHSAAAVKHTGRRVYVKDLFCNDCRIGKCIKLWLVF